jgi:hypothetical protein
MCPDFSERTLTVGLAKQKGKKEFRVSMHQASILFLFNDTPALTLNDILRHTKMGACVLLEALAYLT